MSNVNIFSRDNRLYANIFEHLNYDRSFDIISDGIITISENTNRLFADAQLLINQGRWATATFILSTADEELAKAYILLDMCRLDFSRHRSVIMRLCRSFYDHVIKYAYCQMIRHEKVFDLAKLTDEWEFAVSRWAPLPEDESYNPIEIHNTHILREIPLYIDFLDHDQRWSKPESDTAQYFYDGLGFRPSDSQIEIERLQQTKDSGLFSPNALRIVNQHFRNHFVNDKTPASLVSNVHKKVASQIEEELEIAKEKYLESAHNGLPFYYFASLS